MPMDAADEKYLANYIIRKNECFSQVANDGVFSISAAPAYIREGYRDLFEPTVVSIGPRHQQSHPRSDDKWRYLHDLLQDVQNPPEITVSLVQATNQVAERAHKCYGGTGKHDRSFVQMMLLDGCFLIEFLLRCNTRGAPAEIGWNQRQIKADLLMLENQIPFFVLQQLYITLAPSLPASRSTSDSQLVDLALVYLSNGSYQRDPSWGLRINANGEIDHLLHLYQLWSVATIPTPPQNGQPASSCNFHVSCKVAASGSPPLNKQAADSLGHMSPRVPLILAGLQQASSSSSSTPSEAIPPTATGLAEAGVTMKKKMSASLFDITFRSKILRNATLEIPQLEIDPPQKAILANLFVFEQSRNDLSRYWTAYVKFVKNIIGTPKDIAILSEAGIVNNCLASAEELASFFNQLAPSGDLESEDHDNNYFGVVVNKVNQYCESEWHKWRASLMRDYFNNPWSIISFLAAIVLLILTIVQTYYTVIAYEA